MNIIVISNRKALPNEANLINQLFDEGLQIFHLRKPEYSELEIIALLNEIKPEYHNRIAIHQHHKLAKQFNINRIHFTEAERKKTSESVLEKLLSEKNILSTSIHNLSNYENLSKCFEYTFFGPLFESISKPGYQPAAENIVLPLTSKTKLIALGGIKKENINSAINLGFDGVATLGIIWNDTEKAINTFKGLENILEKRKYVLTVAGFDPSNGAGLTADIKTFEQHKVYGLSICTAITLQTENEFFDVRWEKINDVIYALEVLLKKYDVSVIKTGIVPSFDFLNKIVSYLNKNYPEIKIIVDPIFKSSTGFDFYKDINKEQFFELLKKCFLITPNTDEVISLGNITNAQEAAKEISNYCNVLLKGGHNIENLGIDYLFYQNKIVEFKPENNKVFPKHGSGCILSAAIAANLTLGLDLETACKKGKSYTEKSLQSNSSLLAYHNA